MFPRASLPGMLGSRLQLEARTLCGQASAIPHPLQGILLLLDVPALILVTQVLL